MFIRIFMSICVTIFPFFLTASAAASERDIALLFDAEFADVISEAPPEAADWQTVRLPHFTPRENSEPRSGWYRIAIQQPSIQQPAIYLWRYSMNAQVWLNDELVGGSGRFEHPITRNWNRPFLYRLPRTAWQQSDNFLYVRLATYPGWGYLAPLTIGPFSELEPQYLSRFFWQIRTNQIATIICLMAALVAFVLWMTDRKSTEYGVFAVLCLAWSVFCISNFLQDSPVSAKAWWWTVHFCLDLYGALIGIFIRRLAGLQFNFIDKLLLAFAGSSALIYASLPLLGIADWNNYLHLISLSITSGSFLFGLYRSLTTPNAELIAFTLCMLFVTVFGTHDLLMTGTLNLELWRTQYFWLQFGVPILTLGMMVMMTRKYAMSLLLQIDAEQEVRKERERIFSDIHDDVGSKLLSIIYAAENETQAEIARDALRETRAIVAGALSDQEDLALVLQSIETEAHQRCDEAGATLNWATLDVDALAITDAFRYHLQRIVRELVTNSLKHGNASQIDVNATVDQNKLVLTLQDNGGVAIDESYAAGTGISNINRRCRELDGSVNWKNANPGCLVSLKLPVVQLRSQRLNK